jgi:hypothetical protein
MGSFDLPGHPLHFAGEMRPAYQTREPACLLASIAVIRLRSSWPGRIPRPLFLGGSGKNPARKAHARSRTSDLRDLKPKVRANTPRARVPQPRNYSAVSFSDPIPIVHHPKQNTPHVDLAGASWTWAPSLASWAAPVRDTPVANATELGVTASAGFSITFWTELNSAPWDFVSILLVTTIGEADGAYRRWPGVWFNSASQLHVSLGTTASTNENFNSATVPYKQRFLVGVCFTPNSLTLRVRGVGGFALSGNKVGNNGDGGGWRDLRLGPAPQVA